MLTEVIVLQKIEVAHLLSHGDLLHPALVQVELLGNINITVQNRPHTGLSIIELQHMGKLKCILKPVVYLSLDATLCFNIQHSPL